MAGPEERLPGETKGSGVPKVGCGGRRSQSCRGRCAWPETRLGVVLWKGTVAMVSDSNEKIRSGQMRTLSSEQYEISSTVSKIMTPHHTPRAAV